MNKFEPSPNQTEGDSPGSTRANNPNEGEAAHRQKRPRAPQFGNDRRNPREMDAKRPKAARHHGDANGLPRNEGNRGAEPERRTATQDRRRSYT
ncbi:MAG TPA: hypothetical protein VF460_14935 [Burkholderiales bacterium]